MYKGKHLRQPERVPHSAVFYTVGTLFILTMLSVWLLSGLFAKYVVTDKVSDDARVAAGGTVDIWEHVAKETYPDSGVYELLKPESDEEADLTKENKYKKVLPGVDIPKDPFVVVDLSASEVDYVLYLEVSESDNFPYKDKDQDEKQVVYTITDDWKLISKDTDNPKVYVYVGPNGGTEPYVFDSGSDLVKLPILVDNKLEIKEHFFGGDIGEFSLAFSAYIRQAD